MAYTVNLSWAVLTATFLLCGTLWAADTSALPTWNSDACNSLCRSWMAMGQKQTVPVDEASAELPSVNMPLADSGGSKAYLSVGSNSASGSIMRHLAHERAGPAKTKARQRAGQIASMPNPPMRDVANLEQMSNSRMKVKAVAALSTAAPNLPKLKPLSTVSALAIPPSPAHQTEASVLKAEASTAPASLTTSNLIAPPAVQVQAESKIVAVWTTPAVELEMSTHAVALALDRSSPPFDLDVQDFRHRLPQMTGTPIGVRFGFYMVLAALFVLPFRRRRSVGARSYQ